MNKIKEYILNFKSRKIREISEIVLEEKYNEFEKYINLFYDNKKRYTEEILKDKEIFGTEPESSNIYTALKNFAAYNNKGVLYYKADLFDEKAEWNRTAEMFDILFEGLLSQEIILEVLRKCFFTDEKYDIKLFFRFISGVLNKNSLKIYFWDDGSDLLLFFILKKEIEIKYSNILVFLSNDGKNAENTIYSVEE